MLKIFMHPLTRNLDIDNPETTLFRKQLIQEKALLKKIYGEWYSWISSHVPAGDGRVLELGSGAGFFEEFIPGLITSDVFPCLDIRVVMDGCCMPFADGSLKAIVMVDVFHHLPDAESFLGEAMRCLRPGGKILMVEPWVTSWSSFVYSRLHHEPFDVHATCWSFPRKGPLSCANSALPWIVFERDRVQLQMKHPGLLVESIDIEKPFLYLLSGGVSLRSFMPGSSFKFIRAVESILMPWMRHLGMFARIVLSRT